MLAVDEPAAMAFLRFKQGDQLVIFSNLFIGFLSFAAGINCLSERSCFRVATYAFSVYLGP